MRRCVLRGASAFRRRLGVRRFARRSVVATVVVGFAAFAGWIANICGFFAPAQIFAQRLCEPPLSVFAAAAICARFRVRLVHTTFFARFGPESNRPPRPVHFPSTAPGQPQNPPVYPAFRRLRRPRCRSSGVEHSLGKGEVVSSNLTGSTSRFQRYEEPERGLSTRDYQDMEWRTDALSSGAEVKSPDGRPNCAMCRRNSPQRAMQH